MALITVVSGPPPPGPLSLVSGSAPKTEMLRSGNPLAMKPLENPSLFVHRNAHALPPLPTLNTIRPSTSVEDP